MDEKAIKLIKGLKMPRGGARAGAGRKAGVPNKRNAAVRAAGDRAIAQLKEPFEGDSVALMTVIYKDTSMPLATRMAAARDVMAFERPRLSNVEMTTRSLDRMTDEEFFKAWDGLATFLAQHGRPRLLEAVSGSSMDTSMGKQEEGATAVDTAGRDDVG